ncbi:CBR-HIM-4 protein, partial [Aphelenchoides avenae]
VLLDDQALYTCVAKNEFGQQERSTQLVVTGLVTPVLAHVPPELQLIEGQDLRINCIVLMGTPKPTLQWFKDGLPLQETPSMTIQGDGSLLLIGGDPDFEGHYACQALNAAGNASIRVNVELIRKPVIKSDLVPKSLAAKTGEQLDIPCPVEAVPKPKVIWTLDDHPIDVESPEFTLM